MWEQQAAMDASVYYPQCLAAASAEDFLYQARMGHGVWPAPTEQTVPAYIRPSTCLDAGDKTWMVVISGLDGCMCKTKMLEAMLDQAQVAEYVQDCRVKKIRNSCQLKRDISVTFSAPEAAKRCVRHFNGRQWGASGSALEARLLKSMTRMATPHDIEYGLAEESCLQTQHGEDIPEVPHGCVGMASLAAAPILPPPGLETFTLQSPPGLGFSHEEECSKWLSFEEDSTDAGTSVIDDDPADEEAQIIVSL